MVLVSSFCPEARKRRVWNTMDDYALAIGAFNRFDDRGGPLCTEMDASKSLVGHVLHLDAERGLEHFAVEMLGGSRPGRAEGKPPGVARASATRSAILRAGSAALISSTSGERAISTSGMKSVSGSYGRFLCRLTLVAMVELVATMSV